ncbi:MAG TPA: thioredoxin family protein [Bacteroidales bacterium]|nr:thioredoxin family protein [Bacteroidales bacterium]
MIISEDVLIREIINEKQTALVLVNSRWNGTAQIARSGFDELKKEYGDTVRFNRIMTEDLKILGNILNLGYSPSWLFYYHGELKEVVHGLRPVDEVKKHLNTMLNGM